jgi:hypothetical protein
MHDMALILAMCNLSLAVGLALFLLCIIGLLFALYGLNIGRFSSTQPLLGRLSLANDSVLLFQRLP